MKKTAIATAVALSMGAGLANADAMSSATFSMYDKTGSFVGSDTAVTGSVGGGTWSVASTVTFFGETWNAHDGTTWGLGVSPPTIDSLKGGTSGPFYTGIVVGPNQIAGHILFDWGAADTGTSCLKASCDIDVINVWNVSTVGGVTTYTSTDVVGNRRTGGGVIQVLGPDGTPGLPMIDGAFELYQANFDFTTGSVVPVPAAVWLFGSGLLGLVGVARRKKTA